ncbi:TRAP transporter substrate-binding protein DctP [Telmatospirillum sp.]|uniref:TRAP transporter substrate-binding protein DctP n=1 Tax=Telmatospirillum sp. TaxID=2079197 RepID=UPI002840EA03|nr:TRAP transporter substrate-binding protein DctP [Telmatospirillum sp.]MDR3439368.1 TRAP transporter substrate-binding protein DctP [Telmatospirillum sp.]
MNIVRACILFRKTTFSPRFNATGAIMRLTLVIFSIAYVLGLGSPVQAKETLIFAHLFPEKSPQQQYLIDADRELMQRTGGQLGLDIRPHGQIGDQDTRIMEAMSLGQADMTLAGAAFGARDYAPLAVVATPFGFRDYEHWQHFKTSQLARELREGYEKASGMVLLGYYYYGTRHIHSKVPVRKLEDLAGLKIRVPNAPVFLQLFRALGATPVPLPFWQTYDALKQGTIDAEENPLPTIDDARLYDGASYISLSGHVTDTAMVLISARRLNSLSASQQQLVRDVFAKVADRLSETIHVREQEEVVLLKAKGVTFFQIDRAAFAARVAPFLKSKDFAWSGDLYERLQGIQ